MPYPKGYEWLGNVGPLPRVVSEGLKLVGVVETPGPKSTPAILQWRDELAAAGIKIDGYSDDSIPWCGLFLAIVAHRAGKPVVANPLWARNWASFGAKSPQASLGDVLVFVRDDGGHVGIYIGEDATAYHVLGGNQSDRVCITRIAKARCFAVRRPPFKSALPASARPYHLAATGGLSRNEA